MASFNEPNTLELQSSNRSLSELRTDDFGLDQISQNSETEIEMRSLPPTDHGKQAYLVLAGCTLIQAPVWGYSLAFGVFQDYYSNSKNIKGTPGQIATVGTTLNGIMYLMMPLTFTLLASYPRMRRYCGPAGLLITVGSLVLSSYATKVWQLIASQGVLCAIGSGLLFSPTTLYLDEWFVARKGMAYGVMWAGKAASGVVFPFLMSSLLKTFGPRTTLQAWAISILVITAPLLYFLKPRIPVSTSNAHRRLSWTFLKHSTFWMMQLGNVIQAFGYLLPATYLASYITALGFSSTVGAILIALNNLTSVPGGIVVGMLVDGKKFSSMILLTSLGSTLAVFLVWGLAKHLSLLVIFALAYGFFAGSFSSTYSGILQEMKRTDESLDTGLVMGLLLGGRGLGFVVCGPVSASLLGVGGGKMGWGYDGQYGPVILATGATALLGSWGWMWKMVKGAIA